MISSTNRRLPAEYFLWCWLTVLPSWGCGPDGKTATQYNPLPTETKLSKDIATWLDRYGAALDESDRFRKEVQQLYDESVALRDRLPEDEGRRVLTSVHDALKGILSEGSGSGRFHDEQRARQDPPFRLALEQRLKDSLGSIHREALRLKDEGKVVRAKTLLNCAGSCFEEGTPARDELQRYLREVDRAPR